MNGYKKRLPQRDSENSKAEHETAGPFLKIRAIGIVKFITRHCEKSWRESIIIQRDLLVNIKTSNRVLTRTIYTKIFSKRQQK